MKILITGGNGYIAQRLFGSLSSSYEVVCEPRSRLDVTDGSMLSDYLSRNRYDVVIHTAIVGGSRLKIDDAVITDTNLLMYYNLLSNRKKIGRLISFGSGAEMFMPDSPYGISKKIIAESIRTIDNFYNLRIFSVFDEKELPTRFIKANIIRYIQNQPMIIHQNKIMDFFYMKDLISLVNHYLVAESPQKEIDCCYDQKNTLAEIAEFINKLGDHRVPIEIEDDSKLTFYCGGTKKLPIEVSGLKRGILETYNNLKKEHAS